MLNITLVILVLNITLVILVLNITLVILVTNTINIYPTSSQSYFPLLN